MARSGLAEPDQTRGARNGQRRPRSEFVAGDESYGARTRSSGRAGLSSAPAESEFVTETSYASSPAAPARRTVTITGHGAEGYASRNGTRPSTAQRHRQIPRHERAGFRPDRVALWAVLLGVVLMLAAATSSHAATLAAQALALH